MTNKIKQMFARMSAQLVKPTLAIFAMLAIGGAWGDQHNWLGAQGTQLYWEDSSSWSDPEATTVTEWIINVQGAKVGFKTAYAQNYVEGDTAPLIILSGNEAPIEFTADDDNSAYGLTKNGPLDVGAWWSGYGTGNLKVNSGTYSFTDINIGRWANLNGNLAVVGGMVIANNVYVGLNENGNSANGTLVVSGAGELRMGGLWGQSTGSVSVDGGKIIATKDNEWFINGEITFTVGANGGTLDTNGKTLTIIPRLSGSGTLDIIGGGNVTFAVRPSCTVSSSDNTTYTMPDPPAVDIPEGAYCWIGTSGGSWNDGANWSMSINGPAANDYPKAVLTDVAYIGNATTISLSGTASASNVICAANVTFTGGGTLMSYSVNGSGIVSLNGARLQTPRTDWVKNADLEVLNDLVVSGDNTIVLTASTRISGGRLRLSGDISGTGNITVAKSDPNDTYGEAVMLGGNNVGFTGTYTVSLTKGSRGNNSYANKFLTSASGSAGAAWNIFYGGEPSTSNGLFDFSDGEIEFGSLNARLPAYSSGTFGGNTIKVGALGYTDNIYGSWGVSVGNGVKKVGSGVLYYGAENTANIIVCDGTVIIANANGLPSGTLVFNDLGGTVSVDENVDSAVNSAAIVPNVSGTINVGDADITLGAISGGSATAVVTKDGEGRLSLPSVSTTEAGLNILAGSVELGVGSSIGVLSMSEGTILVFEADPQWGSEQQVNLFTYDSENSNVTLSKDNVKIEGLGGSSDYTLDFVNGTVVANVAAPTLVWASSDGVWDSGTPWSVNSVAYAFHAGDKVSFTDAPFTTYGVNTITVTINEAVAPSQLSVDVAQGHTYIFEGAAIDSGSMTFSKAGAGNLVLRTAAPENLPAEFSLTGGGLVLGNDSLHGMTITPAGGSLSVDSAIDNGDGTVTTNAVVLADVVSNDINANWVVINSGKLVLTNGMSASITNNGELELKGDFTIWRYLNGNGHTYIGEGAIVRYVSQMKEAVNKWIDDYTGDLWFLPGGTFTYFNRNGTHNNCFGKGVLHFAGGTIKAVDANSLQDITLANNIDVVADTVTTVTWESAHSRRCRLRLEGKLTGSGTVNEEKDVFRLAGDNSGFSGTWNYNYNKATLDTAAMGILSNKSSSSNAVWSITGTPESLTSLYYIEHQSANQTAYFNGLNLNSPNGAIYCKNPLKFVIGENGGDSAIAGALAFQNAGDYSITKKGSGKLALGTGFRMANSTTLGLSGSNDYSANAQTKSITVQDGVFSVENRDLADISVSIAKEVTVDLDRSMGLSAENPADRTVVYTIFQTTGTLAVGKGISVVSESTNRNGKWKLFVETNEGTNYLRSKFFSGATAISLR